MKFTLDQRRISGATTLGEDRFAGVEHERTPKRVLDELEGGEGAGAGAGGREGEGGREVEGAHESRKRADTRPLSARANTPSGRANTPSGRADPRTPRSRTPRSPVHSPVHSHAPSPDGSGAGAGSGTGAADETTFAVPPPLPTSGEGVLDQGLEISALHTRAQRERGFRKRGHVAYTQYTYDPGAGISYKNYVDQLYTGSPVEHYTQVLIWCINQRLTGLRNQPDIGARDQAAINALNALIANLARGSVSLNWTRQTFANLPVEEERAPNPTNAYNREQAKVLAGFLADLRQENREWMEILAQTDEAPAPAAEPAEAVIRLPPVEVANGLAALSARVADLEVSLETAEEVPTRPRTQPAALLGALGL